MINIMFYLLIVFLFLKSVKFYVWNEGEKARKILIALLLLLIPECVFFICRFTLDKK